MHIALVISSLGSGGAERVMTLLANFWAGKGWRVSLIALSGGECPPAYYLDHRVEVVYLGMRADSTSALEGLWRNWKRIGKLRKTLNTIKPDAIISFIDTMNVLTILAARGMKTPLIVSEHIHPAAYTPDFFWRWIRRAVYPAADRLTLLSADQVPYFMPWMKGRLAVIPNPAQRPDALKLYGQNDGRPVLVAAGRLEAQKGFDILLNAFAAIHSKHPEWKLRILGEGRLRGELETLAQHLGLGEDCFEMPGRVADVYGEFNQSEIFVLSSRFEGFPMVLVEAMSCGLAVVATRCVPVIGEIVHDGVSGLLVEPEDWQGLSCAMEKLMTDPMKRAEMGKNAQAVTETYSLERIMQLWEQLLTDVGAKAQ